MEPLAREGQQQTDSVSVGPIEQQVAGNPDSGQQVRRAEAPAERATAQASNAGSKAIRGKAGMA